MRWPLRRQILAPMIAILLLTIAVVSTCNAWLASAAVRRRLQRQFDDVAQTLARSTFPLEASVLVQIRGLTGAEYVAVDDDGKATAASDERFVAHATDSAAAKPRFDLSSTVTAGDRRYFHVVFPVDRRARGRERLWLHVFYSEAAWRDARWQSMWPPLAIGGVSIVFVSVVVSLVTQRMTRPIGDLQSQVNRIAQGDFRPMAVPFRHDEVQDLVLAVNQMVARLAQYEEQVRSSERLRTLGTLGSGIAHQIRNAATGCRIALDLHQRDCPLAASNGHEQTSIGVAVRQLVQIETHVQRFLTLGRPAAALRVRTDLGEVASAALELMRPLAKHNGVALSAQIPATAAVVLADPHALTQLLVNLMMNAVQAAAQAQSEAYLPATATKAPVEVCIQRPNDLGLEVAIGDSGRGPSAAIVPRLFEPFATDKAGGTGLGLAVARQIAEDHSGSIRFERRNDKTWFIVSLPTAETEAS